MQNKIFRKIKFNMCMYQVKGGEEVISIKETI